MNKSLYNSYTLKTQTMSNLFLHDDFSSDDDDKPSVAVAHRFSGAPASEPLRAASMSDCLSAIKRGLDTLNAGEGFDSVVQVDDLRKKRRVQGYQADDGTTKLRGAESDVAALYGETWLAERLTRQRMLDNNRYYQFAVVVAANSNLPLEQFTNETQIQQATTARIRDAAQRLRIIREQQRERASAPANIDAQLRVVADAESAVNTIKLLRSDLKSAIECFVDGAQDESLARQTRAIVAPIEIESREFYNSLFDTLSRLAIIVGGPLGFTHIEQKLQTVVQTVANELLGAPALSSGVIARRVRDEMPRAANIALQIATLLWCANDDALLRILVDEVATRFAADAEYRKTPALFAHDLVTLANLMRVGAAADNLLLFDNITFLFYAHLNKMRRRGALLDEPELQRPQPPATPSATRSRTVRLNERDIIFDLGDDEFEALAEGEPRRLYSQDELRRIQTTLAPNQSQADTPALIESILRPMMSVWSARLFYDRDFDAGADFQAFAGTTQLGAIRFVLLAGVRAHPLVSVVIATAAMLVRSFAAAERNRVVVNDLLQSMIEVDESLKKTIDLIVGPAFSAAEVQIEAYKKVARGRLIRTSSVLLCFAKFAIARADANLPLDGIDKEREEQLRRYVAASLQAGARLGGTKDSTFAAIEDAAYNVFSNTLLARGVEIVLQIDVHRLLFAVSQQKFYNLAVTDKTDAELNSRQIKAIGTLAREAKALDDLRTLRDKQLKAIDDVMHQELANILEEEYLPTAQSALSPLNSGVLFFSGLMMGALSAAYTTLRQTIPCVAAVYDSHNALIESDNYWELFAALVQAQVRLIDARNPTTYRPVINEPRARLQVRSALDAIRWAARSDRSIRHLATCSCRGLPFAVHFVDSVPFWGF